MGFLNIITWKIILLTIVVEHIKYIKYNSFELPKAKCSQVLIVFIIWANLIIYRIKQ